MSCALSGVANTEFATRLSEHVSSDNTDFFLTDSEFSI